MGSKYESAQATIASLDAKLDELVKAKSEHEEELISKFVLLLNEKKLKIRNQQRLLSTAKVDKTKLQQMQKTLEGRGRQVESSRAGKRRADAQADEEEGAQNESSDGFEKMDLDKQEGIVAASQDASSERQTTPETGTETDSDGAAPEAIPKARPALRSTMPARAEASGKTTSPPLKPTKSHPAKTRNASPPPPVRQLPFAKKSAKTKMTSEPEPQTTTIADTREGTIVNDSGEETASDDDEL